MSTQDLARGLEAELSALPVPPGDLDRAIREGTSRRRRRRVGIVAAASTVVLLAGGLGMALLGGEDPGGARVLDPAGVGPFDVSGGLRAYADPGVSLHLGDQTFPAEGLGALDTDASATDLGVVHTVSGRPYLLGPDGTSRPLVEGTVDDASSFHPGSRADRAGTTVVVATLSGDEATLHLVDLRDLSTVATRTLECGGGCEELRLDALDGGRVFLRGRDGAAVWDTRDDSWTPFGERTRVADVRNGVVLHDGPPAPELDGLGLRQVAGAIDSQLTFDGGHVLAWSSRLEPTTPGGEPILLERGAGGADRADKGALGFWTIDSDGSVLLALSRRYPRYDVLDCEVPSGRCEKIGTLETTGGDPAFMGNDM